MSAQLNNCTCFGSTCSCTSFIKQNFLKIINLGTYMLNSSYNYEKTWRHYGKFGQLSRFICLIKNSIHVNDKKTGLNKKTRLKKKLRHYFL